MQQSLDLKAGKDLINASDDIAQLAVQGPLALKAMQKLTKTPVEDMEYYTFKVLEFAGINDVIFSTTGYTGAGGCEIYVKNEDGPKLWKAVFEAGKEFDIKPIGLGARDTFVLKWVFAFMGMISMIRHHLLKPVWDGLQNLPMIRILLIKLCY